MVTEKKMLHLKIIFDTNVIYNSSSSDLLRKEITELLEKYSNPTDIKISWHLPEIVVDERRFQMRKRGSELLFSVEKLERLLGHNLNITKEILCSRIDDAINRIIGEHKIDVEKLIVEKINWNEIIKNAAFRLPPFEDSDKEKGFRDAMVLETVLQVIDKSPVSSKICRIIFITNDKLLSDAYNAKIISRSNASLVSAVDELESSINILDSEVKEDLINSIAQLAQEFFFLPNNQNTLYYKEKIGESLNQKFANELMALPLNATKRDNLTWWIAKPGFVKKEKQRIYWKTSITVDAKAANLVYASPSNLLSGLTGLSKGIGLQSGLLGSRLSSNLLSNMPQKSIYGIESGQPTEETIATGKSKFEVIWSVTLTTNKVFKNPKVESIQFVETTWTP